MISSCGVEFMVWRVFKSINWCCITTFFLVSIALLINANIANAEKFYSKHKGIELFTSPPKANKKYNEDVTSSKKELGKI